MKIIFEELVPRYVKSGAWYVLKEEGYKGTAICGSKRSWLRIVDCLLKGRVANLYMVAVTNDIASDTWSFFDPTASWSESDPTGEEKHVITIPDSMRLLLAHHILGYIEAKNGER